MKLNLKKFTVFFVISLMTVVFASFSVSAKIGDPIGNVLHTDIKAYVNDYEIPCYNIEGNIVVVAEDLVNYGFNVAWDSIAREVDITFNSESKITPLKVVPSNEKPGTVAFPYVYTDIISLVNGRFVSSSNIKGYLCIPMEELSVYGSYVWDGNARTVKLILPEKSVTFGNQTVQMRIIRKDLIDYYSVKSIMNLIGGKYELDTDDYYDELITEYGFVRCTSTGEHMFVDGNEPYMYLDPIFNLLGFEQSVSGSAVKITRYEEWNGITVAEMDENAPENENLANVYNKNYAAISHSYMYADNKSFKTVDVVTQIDESSVYIRTFDDKYNLTNEKLLDSELPIFGGFYSGSKYNYILYGQNNYEESATKEVIRIVKYDKDYKKLDSLSITGGEAGVYQPYCFANTDMKENGDTLVVYVSKEQFKIQDGYNHQLNMEIIINVPDMRIVNELNTVVNKNPSYQANHVSHSFYNGVLFDNGTRVMLNLGDAYPRTIQIARPLENYFEKVTLYNIDGNTGDNYTGVMLGGFEMSEKNYIVAAEVRGTKLVNTEVEENRNIVIFTVSRTQFNESTVKMITLCDYTGSSDYHPAPQLVRINSDKFIVMWQEYDGFELDGSLLKYVYIDGNGKVIGDIESKRIYFASDCQPIVNGDKIVWHTNFGNKKAFFELP